MTQPETSITLKSTIVSTRRQVDTRLDEDLVILNLENSIYYGFQDDPVAEFIWRAVQRPVVASDVVEGVLEAFEVERTQCESDVLTFLSRLLEERLVTIVD